MPIDISVIIPLLNEEESIKELNDWIKKVMGDHHFSYEVLFIDDGSTDSSWKIICGLSDADTSVKGIKFNRNYGKSAALQTGFRESEGEVVITMDADLQDSPEEIPALHKMVIEEGYDMVSGWKKKRRDPISKKIPSKIFNFFTRMISGIKLHDFNCGLKAYRRQVVKNINVYGEMHRYIPVIANWNGFSKIGEKQVEHQARKYGSTKYGLERFINGFLDLISITFVSKFKRQPMHFFGTLGTLSFVFGFILVAMITWEKIDSIYFSKIPLKRDVIDQPIFFISLVAIIIGMQLFLTGFLAELMAMRSESKLEYLVVDRKGFDPEE